MKTRYRFSITLILGLMSFFCQGQTYFTDSCTTLPDSDNKCLVCLNTYTNAISRTGFVQHGGEILWFVYWNNELSEYGFFKNGKKTGKWVEFYLSGSQVEVGHYDNGIRIGKWRKYKCTSIDFRRIPEYKRFLIETIWYKKGKFVRKKVKNQ